MRDYLAMDRKTLQEIDKAAQWIKAELEKRAIIVRQAKEKMGRVRVYVTLRHDQEMAYREVYEAAVKTFPKLKKELIYDDADHPDLLR